MADLVAPSEEDELRIAARIQRGYDDMLAGQVRPWSEVRLAAANLRQKIHEGCEAPLSDAEIRSLKQGYDEAMRGELYGAREMLAEIRAGHGI